MVVVQMRRSEMFAVEEFDLMVPLERPSLCWEVEREKANF